MDSRRCLLFGVNPLIIALVSALERAGAEAIHFDAVDGLKTGTGLLDYVDCIFFSVDIGESSIRAITESARKNTDHVRIVLLDHHSEFPELRREIHAHSIVGIDPDQAETIARFWAISLYPRK